MLMVRIFNTQVEFPSISRFRRDTAFPKKPGESASSSSSTPEDIKMKKIATKNDYLIMAELLTAVSETIACYILSTDYHLSVFAMAAHQGSQATH